MKYDVKARKCDVQVGNKESDVMSKQHVEGERCWVRVSRRDSAMIK